MEGLTGNTTVRVLGQEVPVLALKYLPYSRKGTVSRDFYRICLLRPMYHAKTVLQMFSTEQKGLK